MCGFCPDGKKCKLSHPHFEIQLVEERKPFAHIVCHACGEQGHKSTHCAVARRLAAEAAMRGETVPEFVSETTPQNTQPITMDQPQPPVAQHFAQPAAINPSGMPR